MSGEPNTLQEAIIYFSDPANCREYVVARRWPNGVECPRCGGTNVKFMEKYNRWQCGSRHASRQFTLKTGTIFEDSPLGMDKWLAAMWQVVNCKNDKLEKYKELTATHFPIIPPISDTPHLPLEDVKPELSGLTSTDGKQDGSEEVVDATGIEPVTAESQKAVPAELKDNPPLSQLSYAPKADDSNGVEIPPRSGDAIGTGEL